MMVNAPTEYEAAPTDAATLLEQHQGLLRDVRRRAGTVLAVLEARAWPHAELATLTGYLRPALRRQVADEEASLFPDDASAAPFAELSAEHARLYTLTSRLEQVLERRCAPQELRRLVGDLLDTLHRHVAEEERVLATLARTRWT
jgi:hemerythrin-like domain-containing protein